MKGLKSIRILADVQGIDGWIVEIRRGAGSAVLQIDREKGDLLEETFKAIKKYLKVGKK